MVIQKYTNYILPAAFLLIGIILGLLAANWQSIKDFTSSEHRHAIILLEDPYCDICKEEFQRVVEYIEENVDLGGAKTTRLSPYTGEGKRIYGELFEKNVNVVPLIVLTDDLAKTPGFKDINAFLVKVGKYYIFRPLWPVRWYDPGKQETIVEVLADVNVDTSTIKSIAFVSAPNVKIIEENGEINAFLLLKGPKTVIRNIQSLYPLSEVAESVLEVPYVRVIVRAESALLSGITAILHQYPNVQILDANTMENNTIAAMIQTDHPYILARAFPGAQVYPDGLAIPKKATVIMDVYLGTEKDREFLRELGEVATTGRISVIPHYILFLQNGNVFSPLGRKGVDRAILETCAYSIGGANAWFSVARSLSECENIQNCWQDAVRSAGLDANAVFNCYSAAGSQIIQRYVNETSISRITTTAAILNGWYPYLPGSGLKSVICALLSPPLPDICRR